MRILYYTTSYYANHGGSIQSIEFYKALLKRSDVEIFLFPDSYQDKIIKPSPDNRLKFALKKTALFQYFSFLRRNRFYYDLLKKRIRKVNPDVLILQIDSNFLQIERLKTDFPDLKICCQINGSPFDEFYDKIYRKKKLIKKQTESFLLSDLNLFISKFSRERIMGSKIDPKRDKIVYNGTDITKFYPIKNKKDLKHKLGYPENELVLGYIGTLDFHKKILRLLTSFEEVLEKYPNTTLVIIGNGPAFQKLKKFVFTRNLEQKIILKGWVSHSLINEHLNCFDIAIHHYANHYMNPLKIYEYLAVGLPVIAPDIESIRNNFIDKQHLLISRNDNKDLVEEIEFMIENEEFRNNLSSQIQIENFGKKFTWENYANKIIDFVKEKHVKTH